MIFLYWLSISAASLCNNLHVLFSSHLPEKQQSSAIESWRIMKVSNGGKFTFIVLFFYQPMSNIYLSVLLYWNQFGKLEAATKFHLFASFQKFIFDVEATFDGEALAISRLFDRQKVANNEKFKTFMPKPTFDARDNYKVLRSAFKPSLFCCAPTTLYLRRALMNIYLTLEYLPN